MQRDVIIVGGGLAGIMAAFSAQAEGAEVLLIDRGSIGVGTNSILAGGVFAAPTSTYSPDVYIKDTLQVNKGEKLCNTASTKYWICLLMMR